MDQYFGTATIHGFSYLQKKNTLCTKLFWMFILTVAFIGAGTMITYSLIDWQEDQTVTTLYSIAAPIELVQFPTVTICPNPDSPPDN